MRLPSLPASTRRRLYKPSHPLFKAIFILGCIISLAYLSADQAMAWWLQWPLQTTSPIAAPVPKLVLTPLQPSQFGSFTLQPLPTNPDAQPAAASGRLVQTEVLPSPVVTPDASPPAPSVASDSTTLAEQMLALINQIRSQHQLLPLKLHPQLTHSAQRYAEEMQAGQFFSHTSPSGQTLKERNEAAGYQRWSWMGENIAYGQTSVQEVVENWMASPGHRANILDSRAEDLGVGFAPGSTTYWVQEFGAQF